jgi:excisionase family DNA binding protein
MTEPNIFLAEALAAILKPIVIEAVREALTNNGRRKADNPNESRIFLTVKQAAETSGLGGSTIRLAIRRKQLQAHNVGRRVLLKKTDLEKFLEADPIAALNN